ncbi:unnamed protein product [Penicillium bialowiezense]
MANGKPSVFMINSRTLPEPLDPEPSCWVTVYFHDEMAETHWDEDLVECISLPVTGVSLRRDSDVFKRAAYIAQGWYERILTKQVQLDRERIFFKCGGSLVAPPKILEDGEPF